MSAGKGLVMAALLVLTILMTAGAFYFAFISSERLFKSRRIGAFLVLLVLTLVATYASWQERTAAAHLAAVIAPYPHTSQVIWVPATGTGGRYWILKTPDAHETVSAYYRGVAQREGWILGADDGHTLAMQKGPRCLTLIISRRQSAGQTTIIYSLREPC